MLREKIVVKGLAVLAGLLLLSAFNASAQPAPVQKTGSTTCNTSGEDGCYQKGVATSPRFTDNLDGTVTDNLTGLMWTQDAQQISGVMTWANALTACENLIFGGPGCGYINWRLPNVRELNSLLDYGNEEPTLPSGHPFTNVPPNLPVKHFIIHPTRNISQPLTLQI